MLFVDTTGLDTTDPRVFVNDEDQWDRYGANERFCPVCGANPFVATRCGGTVAGYGPRRDCPFKIKVR